MIPSKIRIFLIYGSGLTQEYVFHVQMVHPILLARICNACLIVSNSGASICLCPSSCSSVFLLWKTRQENDT